ncbi:hypothetical protein [Nocardiopsis ganjiahuensis]|uniref:hypothetical protein n=1 Tax=Nocardiopsis ganjiahuensis TaxID=239984 RepID=UPI0003454927|nr:hypothetical protein [Nocardiopsis ganjiahuensis]
MNQPPPNGPGGPYQGPPNGMPPTGGQPPMGPPPQGGMPPGGGQPPMGPPPPGGMPPGGPYGGDPYGGGPGGPYGGGPGGPGGPYGGDPYGGNPQGGPYGGAYPPPPPAAKKTSPWLWISLGCGGLFVIGVVLVLLLVFVFADSDDSGGSSGPSTTEEGEGGGSAGATSTGLGNEERSNPDMPALNEQIEHNGMLFTIVEVETGLTEVGYFTPLHEYVVMHVEVAPAGTEDIEFWRDEQHLYTYSGQEIGEDYSATLSYDDSVPMGVEVSPGESVVVAIVFDVQDPSEVSHMGLSAEYLGGDEVDVDVTG